VEYTLDPGQLEGFVNEPCEGSAGCRRLVPDWGGELLNFRVDGGYLTADGGMFYFIRYAPLGRRETWLVRADGRPLAAVRSFRGTDVCRAGAFDADENGFVFVVTAPFGPDLVRGWLLGARWESEEVVPRNFGRLSDLLPVTTTFFQTIRIGRTRYAVESAPWHSIIDMPFDGEAHLIADSSDGGQVNVAEIVEDTVLYDVFGYPSHVRASTAGERGEVLIAPRDAGANGVATDGSDLVWIQSYFGSDGEVERLELWASPFATRQEDLTPRRVADIAGLNASPRTAVGNGYAAVLEPTAEPRRAQVALIRLEDGARTTLTAPSGMQHRIPPFIGAEVIAVPLGVDGVPPQDDALLLIDIESLEFTRP